MARVSDGGVYILTGANDKSVEFLSSPEIKTCLSYFANKDWFLLGNNVKKIREGGLGEHFRDVLHKSAKYVSRYAAIWANQELLEYRYEK